MPTIDLKLTGENIEKMRKKAGMTVKDVQAACGLGSAYAVYKWQAGKTLPTLDNMVVLARVFGTTIDKIVVVNL